MYPVCDLHTHSTFSDGTRTPTQLVAQAQAIGLRAMALTDHNTVAGLPEFLNAARGTTLKAIPGVEISTGYHGKELHIVGLFVRPDQFEALTDFLSVITLRKNASNRGLIAALCQAGYELDYDEILGSHPGNVNRAVIASEMLRKGYVRSVKEAVETLLSEKRGYYVPPERISSLEAIGFLRSIGAAPVLAHPFLSMSEGEIRAFLPEAKACGLAAMETITPPTPRRPPKTPSALPGSTLCWRAAAAISTETTNRTFTWEPEEERWPFRTVSRKSWLHSCGDNEMCLSALLSNPAKL